MHIAINGWHATASPASPERYQVHEVAERLAAEADVRITVISPEPLAEVAGEEIGWQVAPAPLTEWGRIQFEQSRLVTAAAKLGAELVLHLGPTGPIRSPVPNLVRVIPKRDGSGGLVGRLRRSMGWAGAVGASGRFYWLDDLAPSDDSSVAALPPFVGASFRATDPGSDNETCRSLGLPPAYVLAHGLHANQRQHLLAAWTWVEASIGDQIPLVVIGWDPDELRASAFLVDVSDSVRTLPAPSLSALPAIYRSADAFFFPAGNPNGAELRWALACGVPVAAAQSPEVAAVVGDAGYLAPLDDSRALGAACLTLLVERHELGQRQRQRGLLRARPFHGPESVQALLELAGRLAAS